MVDTGIATFPQNLTLIRLTVCEKTSFHITFLESTPRFYLQFPEHLHHAHSLVDTVIGSNIRYHK